MCLVNKLLQNNTIDNSLDSNCLFGIELKFFFNCFGENTNWKTELILLLLFDTAWYAPFTI